VIISRGNTPVACRPSLSHPPRQRRRRADRRNQGPARRPSRHDPGRNPRMAR
jgi:hypothetical protein